MRSFTLGILVAIYSLPALSAGGVGRVIPGTAATMGQSIDNNLRVTASTTETPATRSTPDDATAARTTRIQNSTRTVTAAQDAGRTIATRNITRAISNDVKPISNSDVTRSTTNRSVAITRSVAGQDTARSNLEATVQNVGRSQRTEAASINANPAVRRAGLTLRPSTAEVGGRAIMESGAQTGSNIETEIQNMQSRVASVRVRNDQKLDPVAIAETKTELEQAASLNKSCQEQYNDCMDQFCSVIDANQKRCSCSSNLAKYAKVEKAVKDANAELNEVAQNIRYVGLSADEISAIMSATEAEEAMTGVTDTSENRNLLAQIEKMIKDPTTTSTSAWTTTDSLGLLDIDLDFSSDEWADLFSLEIMNNGATNSLSNLRGTSLYNAAKKRCNTIVNQCKEVGATAQQITGNYDLAIDKDCIAYEQGLNKMNETLVSNVRSATRMLQKARLAVLQNQNAYDARGCIGALETCMTDDMVCGEDYLKCVDPTKMYVDENGSVVLGNNINNIQKYMTEYNNAKVDSSWLATSYSTTISDDTCANSGNDGRCVVKYLLSKIGTLQDPVAEGLCRPVLDKCRAYTYDTRGNYNRFNDIVVNYIQRAMVNIRAAQYNIVSNYASTCLNDIATCYNAQVSQITSWAQTASVSSVYGIMRGACRNVALTCGYAIFAADQTSCPENNPNRCIESISETFYQSLLCPDNSDYVYRTSSSISPNNTIMGYANKLCKCREGYVTFNGSCLPVCEDGQYLSTGVCGYPANCPTNSYNIDSANAEFWGHCKCSNSYYWYENGKNCVQCPENSKHEPTDGYTGDTVYEGLCTCKANYFKYQGNRCKACPDNSTLRPNYSNASERCDCSSNTDKPFYNYYCNTCVADTNDIKPSANCIEFIEEYPDIK